MIVKRLLKNYLLMMICNNTLLTAINSINWARLIAGCVLLLAYLQINKEEINFIVPSGNFGNVFSANVAKNGIANTTVAYHYKSK